MSGFFKSKKEAIPAPQEITTPTMKKGRNILFDFLGEGFKPAGAPAGVDILAPRTFAEEAAPSLLQSFIKGGFGDLFGAGKTELQKIIEGRDPLTSPEFESFRRQIREEGAESTKGIRQAAQLGGQLRSTGRVGQETELQTDIVTAIGDVMAKLTAQERGERVGAIPLALQFAAAEKNIPIQALQAIQQFSPRKTEQADIDRMFQEFLRTRGEELGGIDIAKFLSSPQSAQFFQPQFAEQPSGFSQFLMPLIQGTMLSAGQAGGFGKLFS